MIYRLGRLVSEVARAFSSVVKKKQNVRVQGFRVYNCEKTKMVYDGRRYKGKMWAFKL